MLILLYAQRHLAPRHYVVSGVVGDSVLSRCILMHAALSSEGRKQYIKLATVSLVVTFFTLL